MLSITSFALYGFPESHAASFALIAYASAYLKCHYLAAFTAALLNNQPMGFYSPATLVKDAQRHGLKVLPVDVMKSEWECTLERKPSAQQSAISSEDSEKNVVGHSSLVGSADDRRPTADGIARITQGTTNAGTIALRLGLRYVRGLHEEAGRAIAQERNLVPFTSIHDLVRRVPELRKERTEHAGGNRRAEFMWNLHHRDTETQRNLDQPNLDQLKIIWIGKN